MSDLNATAAPTDAFDIGAFCEEEGDNPACHVHALALDIKGGVDTFFLLYAGAVVFVMQAGFAMLCAGSVRQKNVKNIMLKNLLDACGGAIGFFSLGYGLAYGGEQTGATFVGDSAFALYEFENYASWFFQFAFAATAATIVAGTVAERCKMAAYLCYSLFLSAFVYPVVVHAIWSGNGYLTAFPKEGTKLFRDTGVIDFAGSGVVHYTGGLTALIAAIVLGPRKGRFYDDDGNPLDEPAQWQPHSVALQILGTFLLWFGWYGFNPGSALTIANSGSASTASLAAVTTTLAAAAGCITAMFTDSIIESMATGEVSYDLTMAMNGCLGGLVAVTSSCATIEPFVGLIIGGIGGLVYLGGSKLLIKLRIDDAVDAVPVHFCNGIWGVIAAGLFSKFKYMAVAGFPAEHQGWFYEFSDPKLLINQIIGLILITVWVTGLMLPFFVILNALGMFRIDPLEEEVGLDISHHRGAAYDLNGPSKDVVEELMEVRASRHGKVEVPSQFGKHEEDDA